MLPKSGQIGSAGWWELPARYHLLNVSIKISTLRAWNGLYFTSLPITRVIRVWRALPT